MRRRSLLTLSGTALATTLAGCAGLGDGGDAGTPTGDPPTTGDPTDGGTTPGDDGEPQVAGDLRNGSFEDGWAHWTVGRHLPDDPNREGDRAVASSHGVTTRNASDGVTACRLFIDGSQDDGTVWVAQPVDLSAHDYLAVDYVVSDSFNHIRNAAVYAGPEPDAPLVETDFDTSNSLEGHDGRGWKTFTYELDHDGPGIVAVGFSIVWETGANALLDDVRLTSDSPETVTPPTSTPDDGDGAGTL